MNYIYKNIKYLAPVLLFTFLAFIPMKGDFTNQLNKHLETWRINYTPEKVYIHHDKPYYAPGQQIWLKGYVMDAAGLQPTKKSQILYIDLLSADNLPVQRLTLQLENGKAKGDIILPDDLAEGKYWLTGYTQYMRNFGDHTYFHKEVNIVGEQAAKEVDIKAVKDIDLQFFPEGGDMVIDLESRIAFKAIASNGKGIGIAGAIFDEQGKKILDFKDNHLGMGAFELLPKRGRQYFAKVNFTDGSTVDYPLPLAKENGFNFRVENKANQDYVKVIVKGNVPSKAPLTITAICRDELKYSGSVMLEDGKQSHQKIAKSLFNDGIIRLNLANAAGDPLAERLIFIDNQDDINFKITTDKTEYRSRERVRLQIEAKDKQGNPVETDFSLAITDDELVIPNNYGTSIKSYLLLTSDLKGHVENPGYYFEAKNKDRSEALNHLLMTQGWSRFSYETAVKGNFPDIKYRNETDLSITGQLITNKGEPVKNGEVLLYLKDQHDTFIITETNSDGYFSFEGFSFADTIDIVVQGTDAKGRRKHLQIQMDETVFVPQLNASAHPDSDELLSGINKDFLQASKGHIASTEAELEALTLGELVLKDVIVQGRAKIISPATLHNRADVVIRADQLPISPSGNILESLQGRVAGLQITRSGFNEFRATIRGSGTPLYLLDGVPIHESTLLSLNQFDIGRIEILKNVGSAAIYGGRASGGVIALYSKRGGEEELVEVEPGTYIITHRAGGFSKVREFYSPKYSQNGDDTELPDLRTTLYWNPSVKTNEDGMANVTFYTADRNTTYRAILEGISDDGKPGSGMMTFGVIHEKVAP